MTSNTNQKLYIRPFGIPTTLLTVEEAEKVMRYVVANCVVTVNEWAYEFEKLEAIDARTTPLFAGWTFFGIEDGYSTYWSDYPSTFEDNILSTKRDIEEYLRGFSFEDTVATTKSVDKNVTNNSVICNPKGKGKKAAQKKTPTSSHVTLTYVGSDTYTIAGAVDLSLEDNTVIIKTNKVQTHKRGCTKTIQETIEIPFKNLLDVYFFNPKGSKDVTDLLYRFLDGKLIEKTEIYL